MCIMYASPDQELVLKALEEKGFTQIAHKHTGNINLFFRANLNNEKGRMHVRVHKGTLEVHTYKEVGGEETPHGTLGVAEDSLDGAEESVAEIQERAAMTLPEAHEGDNDDQEEAK
ncbi:hypothetical protein D3C81_1625850 [compost metagenome]